MRWLKRPDLWLGLCVLLIAAGGAQALNSRTCRSLDEREWRWFGGRNAWQTHFDALSAACGVGLLLGDPDEDYTPAGWWVLTACGAAGALLYVGTALLAVGRLRSACHADASPAHSTGPPAASLPWVWSILLLFIVLLGLCVPLVAALEWLIAGPSAWSGAGAWQGSAWRAMAAVASLGWLPDAPPRSCNWIYAGVALLGGLGWMVWLLPLARARRRYLHMGRLLGWILGYVVFLLLLAALVFALEAPRGSHGQPVGDTVLTGQPSGARFARSLVQTTCAATAGIPTEVLSDRGVTEGTEVVWAVAVLVGPLGGAAGGGLTWTLLVWAVLGGAGTLFGRRPTHPATLRCLLAGAGCLALLLLLVVIVAFGLLVIETHATSSYEPRHTFADALLDASCAVAGGNLSSGLIETVTDRNLSSGIRQPVDAYQYGMAWLMAAMLLGRLAPVFVLCQAATARLDAPADGAPPSA